MKEQTNNQDEIVAQESNFKPIIRKKNYWKIFGIVIIVLLILGALAYGIIYVKNYYSAGQQYIGYKYGVNSVIQLQNTQGQWFYFTDNNYTIGNVSVQTLCGSLK